MDRILKGTVLIDSGCITNNENKGMIIDGRVSALQAVRKRQNHESAVSTLIRIFRRRLSVYEDTRDVTWKCVEPESSSVMKECRNVLSTMRISVE
ncbi:hypothetical protein NPIL_403731 [Nephila pilipes]|uniref:Uncharacterized protein n=1 Tax=Nephila pilipes TaxID=299642 RepID=A0A8X6R4E1_NEPPI|nr:hypothetical protein NPIL_403731 [Nephila pilipes]